MGVLFSKLIECKEVVGFLSNKDDNLKEEIVKLISQGDNNKVEFRSIFQLQN